MLHEKSCQEISWHCHFKPVQNRCLSCINWWLCIKMDFFWLYQLYLLFWSHGERLSHEICWLIENLSRKGLIPRQMLLQTRLYIFANKTVHFCKQDWTFLQTRLYIFANKTEHFCKQDCTFLLRYLQCQAFQYV